MWIEKRGDASRWWANWRRRHLSSLHLSSTLSPAVENNIAWRTLAHIWRPYCLLSIIFSSVKYFLQRAKVEKWPRAFASEIDLVRKAKSGIKTLLPHISNCLTTARRWHFSCRQKNQGKDTQVTYGVTTRLLAKYQGPTYRWKDKAGYRLTNRD